MASLAAERADCGCGGAPDVVSDDSIRNDDDSVDAGARRSRCGGRSSMCSSGARSDTPCRLRNRLLHMSLPSTLSRTVRTR